MHNKYSIKIIILNDRERINSQLHLDHLLFNIQDTEKSLATIKRPTNPLAELKSLLFDAYKVVHIIDF